MNASGNDGSKSDARELPPAGERVGVVVRVRPLLGAEAHREPAVRVDPEDARSVQVLTTVADSSAAETPTSGNMYGTISAKAGARAFRFDACLGGQASQDEMYAACEMSALVRAALDGYQVTVFAFGQTGAGKTYTISGPVERKGRLHSDDSIGLVARALRETYSEMRREEGKGRVRFSPRATFSEIYNEECTDLLARERRKGQRLAMRHHPHHGFYLEGLTEVECHDEREAINVHETGLAKRRTGSHLLNATSTRSHCLLTLHLDAAPTDGNARDVQDVDEEAASKEGLKRFGRICFVDLAGSERLKETRSTAARETGNINKSLFALGKCLAALSSRTNSGSGGSNFVPFRESKLTQLLIDSLRGRGRALMIACCSPSQAHVDETYNTLHFASLALHIKSKPVVILDPSDKLLLELRSTINTLRSENRQLHTQLEDLRLRGPPPGRPQSTDGGAALHAELKKKETNTTLRGGPSRPAWRPSAPATSAADSRLTGVSPMRREPPATRRVKQLAPDRASVTNAGPQRKTGKKKSIRGTKPKRPASAGNGSVSRAAAAPSPYAQGLREMRHTPVAARTAWGVEDTHGLDGRLARISRENGQDCNTWTSAAPTSASTRQPELKQSPRRGAGAGPGAGSGQAGQSFPTLDALEEQFQRRLAEARAVRTGQATGVTASPSAENAEPTSVQTQPSPAPKPPELEPVLRPEQRALEWAARNPWFGAEVDMTALAYETHDRLVAAGVDTSSEEYYRAIERDVEGKFPDRFHTLPKARRQNVAAHSNAEDDFRELSRTLRSGPAGGMAAMARARTSVPNSQGGDEPSIQLSLEMLSEYPSAAQLAHQAVMGKSTPEDHSAAVVAAKASHSEYVAKREGIVRELRKAKEDAEVERAKIMAEIRQTLRNL